MKKQVLRIGHRGAPSHFWENTIASIQKAIEMGVDVVEFDIRKTLDNQFVLWHSSRMGRFFDLQSRIARKRWHDLTHHRVGHGERIALLQDAIDAVKGTALMNIDLKSRGGEEHLVDLLVRNGVQGDVLISSHHARSLRKIKELDPRIHTGISLPKDFFHLSSFGWIVPLRWTILFLMRRTIRFHVLRQIEKARADVVMLYYKLLTPGLVRFLQERGVPVYAYTVDDVGAIRKLMAMGVHGIASNHPEILLQA
ncbi:MAG: glycerophosphodiester phosphodiesterase [Candidatus Eisenbacteria bacterium]